MTNIIDRLGLTGGFKEIKLGRSFYNDDSVHFHTFRYDFKPASVDVKKTASVDIGDGHQVTVTVPHVEKGSGATHTVFKGSKRQYQKECVLVVDHNTGEITLEKLSCNVQLKKTRSGTSKFKQNPSDGNKFNCETAKNPVEENNGQKKKSKHTKQERGAGLTSVPLKQKHVKQIVRGEYNETVKAKNIYAGKVSDDSGNEQSSDNEDKQTKSAKENNAFKSYVLEMQAELSKQNSDITECNKSKKVIQGKYGSSAIQSNSTAVKSVNSDSYSSLPTKVAYSSAHSSPGVSTMTMKSFTPAFENKAATMQSIATPESEGGSSESSSSSGSSDSSGSSSSSDSDSSDSEAEQSVDTMASENTTKLKDTNVTMDNIDSINLTMPFSPPRIPNLGDLSEDLKLSESDSDSL